MAYLLTGFDLARVGSMRCFVNDGTDSGTVTVTSDIYCHRDLSSVMGSGNYTDLATTLETLIDAVLTTHGSDVSFSLSTLTYTIASAGGQTLSLDFRSATLGDDSGKRLAAALGFTYEHDDATGGSSSDPFNIQLSGKSTYESNVTPYYALALARGGPSDYSRPYHTSGQTKRAVSVNGTAYGVRPRTLEKRVRFRLRFQTLASVFAADASESAPWTYEDLLDHVGTWEPVLLSSDAGDIVFKYVDPDFTEDSRAPVWSDYHGRWDLSVEGQYLGTISPSEE